MLIALGASIIGAICGIGGGVITKPILDALYLPELGAHEVSFLSSVSVFTMALYSVNRSLRNKESGIDLKISLPIAIGASVGGLVGKMSFTHLAVNFDNDLVGRTQSMILLILTFGTFFYTLFQNRITSKDMTNPAACLLTGIGLGVAASFLGIGGGPINLVVLGFLFSMNPKIGAINSLYIILFSQFTSLAFTFISGSTPAVKWTYLLSMIAGGLLGGIVGGKINSKLDTEGVRKLFLVANLLIVFISIYNIVIRL